MTFNLASHLDGRTEPLDTRRAADIESIWRSRRVPPNYQEMQRRHGHYGAQLRMTKGHAS